MSIKKLSDFLNNEENRIYPEAEKQEWITSVNNLYADIELWLNPVRKKISITYEETIIDDEKVGIHEINKMKIDLKGQIVTVCPIGTDIIGCKGRIDMSSRYGDVSFIQKYDSDKWVIMLSPKKNIPLNADIFSECLLGLISLS